MDYEKKYRETLRLITQYSEENQRFRNLIESQRLEIESLKQPLKCPCCYTAIYPR